MFYRFLFLVNANFGGPFGARIVQGMTRHVELPREKYEDVATHLRQLKMNVLLDLWGGMVASWQQWLCFCEDGFANGWGLGINLSAKLSTSNESSQMLLLIPNLCWEMKMSWRGRLYYGMGRLVLRSLPEEEQRGNLDDHVLQVFYFWCVAGSCGVVSAPLVPGRFMILIKLD